MSVLHRVYQLAPLVRMVVGQAPSAAELRA